MDSVSSTRHVFLSRIVAGLLVAVLGGCASLSKKACIEADWYATGYQDGEQGQPALRIAEHRRACAAHGIEPDLQRYAQGREAGLQRYCRPGHGFAIGREGAEYADVCPMPLEAAFLDAYYAGRELFSLESRVSELEREISIRKTELENLSSDIAALEAEIIIAGTTRKVRLTLMHELQRLEQEAAATEQALLAADEERIHQLSQLAELRQQTPDW